MICGILRAAKEFGTNNSVARSSYIVKENTDLCTGCGICVKKCQFEALSIVDKKITIDLDLCYGCGVCVVSCPSKTLSLVKKTKPEIVHTPVNQKEWDKIRTENRK